MGMVTQDVVPFMTMLMKEASVIGLTIMAKMAMARGMSHFVFVFYSNCLSSLILLISSFFFPRINRHLFTFSLLTKFFLLGLIGITIAQNFAFTGLEYSSPLVACAMSNLIPSFSFVLSIIFWKGNLHWRSSSFWVKSMGTLVSMMGALLVLFYKGPAVRNSSSNAPTLKELTLLPPSQWMLFLFSSTPQHWVRGGLFLVAASVSTSVLNLLQAQAVKEYPEVMTIVSSYSLFGTIQCAIVSLIAEKNTSAWRLKLDMELLVILLTAVFGNVILSGVQMWCVSLKGSLYVMTFKPFGIAVAVVLSSILFGDSLYFGSVVGILVIGIGYYCVTWGCIKEEEFVGSEGHGDDSKSPELAAKKIPLLQNELEV